MRDTLIELAKDSPIPVTGGLMVLGVPMPTVIVVATVVWAVVRAASAGWDLYWKVRDKLEERRRGKEDSK